MPRGSKKLGPGPGSSAKQPGNAQWSRRNQAPVLFLSIGGKPADDLLRMTISFSHKRSLGKSAETKFVIRNDSRTLLDDPRTFPNTEWQFRYGYLNDLSPVKSGLIREVAPVYAGKRTVTITLYDALLNMSTKSSGKNWGKVSSSTIANALAVKHGFKAAIQDSNDVPKKAWIQPNDVNDIRYLRDLAVLIDFEVFVDGAPPTMYYRKKDYGSASKGKLIYYDDPSEFSFVKSFAPKVKSLGPIQAGIAGTNSELGKGDKKTAADSTKANSGLSTYLNFTDQGTPKIVVGQASAKRDVSHPVPSNLNTSALVNASRQQMLDKANEATSDHPLTASIQAGDIYEWSGIEKQINGKWYCFEEHSEITGAGSSTKIHWKRNTTGQGAAQAQNRNNSGTGNDAPKVAIVYQTQGSGKVIVVGPGATAPTPANGPTPVR